jgi:type IV pilus assembly protein PilB
VLSVDAAMRQILVKDPSEAAVAAQAKASGMVTLRTAAIIKALRGLTTFEEVVRVTHSDHAGGQACPVCQRPVAHDMQACPWCAAALDRGQCLTCARNLDPNWRICPWCRTPAHRMQAAVPQLPAQPMAQPIAQPVQQAIPHQQQYALPPTQTPHGYGRP